MAAGTCFPMYAGVHGLTALLDHHLHYHFFQDDSGATHVLAWGSSWVKQKLKPQH